MVSEWDLLVVACGQEPDLVHHAREQTRGVRAAREAEYADLVPGLVWSAVSANGAGARGSRTILHEKDVALWNWRCHWGGSARS